MIMKIYNIEGKKRSSLVYTQFETDRNEIELFKIDERSTVKDKRSKFDEGSRQFIPKLFVITAKQRLLHLVSASVGLKCIHKYCNGFICIVPNCPFNSSFRTLSPRIYKRLKTWIAKSRGKIAPLLNNKLVSIFE